MSDVHPEPVEIAELDEDLLPPADAARLRDHLANCRACAEIQAELTTLRHELRHLPDPGPIPDDVAARLDAAVSAVSRETSDGRFGGTGVVPRKIAARETSDGRFGGTGVAPRKIAARETRGRRGLRVALAAAAAVVAMGIGGVLLQALGGATGDGAADAGGMAEDAASAPLERESGDPQLESQVRELLHEAQATDPLIAESAEGQSTQESALPEVPPCVAEAIDRRETPLAAKPEDYAGVDAYLVVLPHTADPEQVDAYVVAAACVTASASDSGEILARESYPRD